MQYQIDVNKISQAQQDRDQRTNGRPNKPEEKPSPPKR